MVRTLIATCILISIATPAYAYIDVALGGLILQALLGGFFAFLVIWRDWMTKFKNFFTGNGFTSHTQTVSTDTKQSETAKPSSCLSKE